MQKALEDCAVILQWLWCLGLCLLDDNQSLKNMYFFSSRPAVTQEKFKNKTSNQKAKEEYEKIKAERARKKEVNLKQSSLLILNKI